MTKGTSACIAIAVVLGAGVGARAAAAAAAAAAPAPQVQLKSTVDVVLSTIHTPDQTAEQRRRKIRDAGLKRFALDRMSALVLGKYWKTLTPERKERFEALFTDVLFDSYVRKIERYAGESVEYIRTAVNGRKAVVATRLASSGRVIKADYKLFRTGDTWLVYDVEIDGVSLIRTYRSQYMREMADAGFDRLTDTMERKLDE